MQTDLKKVMLHLWKHICNQKLVAIILFISLLTAQFSNLVIPIFYGKIFDIIYTAKDINAILNSLYIQLYIILAINLVNLLASRFLDYYNMKFEIKMDIDNYVEDFDYLQKHSYNFFSNNFVGALTKKVNRHMTAFADLLSMFLFDISPFVIGILFILGYIFLKNIFLGLVMSGFLLFVFIFHRIFHKIRYPLNMKANLHDTYVSGLLADDISNNFNITIFGNLKKEKKTYRQELEKWGKLRSKFWFLGNISFGVLSLFMAILEFLIFYIGIGLWKNGIVGIGFFVVIQIYLFDLFRRFYSLGSILKHFFKLTADAQEMIEVLETPHDIVDLPDARDITINEGKVEFQNVGFYYKNDRYVFEDFSLTIKKGEKVAFVGVSGSGKTTLSRLIMRLYDIQKGKLFIDGQDIAKVTQESLRKQISLVPQEPMLFHRSIADNIAYGVEEASREEIIHAAKLAQAHEFISKLEHGYESLVGERGIKLSGGERQRVAIARAILQNNKLLILDEATSSLDSESEKYIQDAIDHVLQDKTAIVIAHRLSTIMKMDRIIVLQHGKIVEDGSHSELLQKQNGIYKKLWDIQVGGFILEE